MYTSKRHRFVGREAELDELVNRLDAACGGGGGVMLIGGRAGHRQDPSGARNGRAGQE